MDFKNKTVLKNILLEQICENGDFFIPFQCILVFCFYFYICKPNLESPNRRSNNLKIARRTRRLTAVRLIAENGRVTSRVRAGKKTANFTRDDNESRHLHINTIVILIFITVRTDTSRYLYAWEGGKVSHLHPSTTPHETTPTVKCGGVGGGAR